MVRVRQQKQEQKKVSSLPLPLLHKSFFAIRLSLERAVYFKMLKKTRMTCLARIKQHKQKQTRVFKRWLSLVH